MEFYKLHGILNRTPKGAFKSMVWERQLKTKKQYADNIITKRTTANSIRFGCSYDNLKAVKAKRESGELPPVNAGLLGKHWLIPNLVLQSDRNGHTLLRVNLANNSKMETEYFLNGRKVSKEDIAPMCYASETKSHDGTEVFDVATDSIISIS